MDTPKIIREVPPNLPANSWVGIDTELFQMDKNRLHRPTTGKFACLTIATDESTVYFIDDENKVAPALNAIKDCVWCFSNAKFDLTQLRRWAEVKHRKKIFDTQLCEQILYSGFFDSFSLKAVTRRYLGEVIEKETRDEFSTASEFTQEMIEYSVLDPVLSLMVAKKQKEKMQPSDIKIWTEIDRPALWAFLDFDGFCIDVPGWLKLAETNKQRQEEIKSQLPINPNSPKQILDKLNKLGFKLKSTGEEELIEQIEKHPDAPAVELAREILNARMYGKRASTYGFDFVNDYIEIDEFGNQMVFADYKIIGAETGRTCVSGDTLLHTNCGTFEIKDLDLTKFKECRIITHTGKYQRILRRIYKGKEQMYEIKTKNGNYIKCTGNHRILTPRGWRFVKELVIGDLAISENNSYYSSHQQWTISTCRRGNFCGIGYSEKAIKESNNQTISRIEQSHSGHIQNSVRKEIFGGTKESKTLSIFNGIAWKHAWKERPTNSFDSKRSFIAIDKWWKDSIQHFKRITCKRICRPSKLQILWNKPAWRTSISFTTCGFGISGVARKVFTWIASSGEGLLQQSRGLLQQIIREPFALVSNAAIHQRAGKGTFLLSRNKKNFQESHLLESQRRRTSFGFGIIGKKHSTHTSIQLLPKVFGRFLFSNRKADCRSSRKYSQFSGDKKKRQRKETNCSKFRNALFGSITNRNSKKLSVGAGFGIDYIESIRDIGIQEVWDIEVEEDHSYLAGGLLHHNSASSPAIQTIPARDTKEFRELFIPKKGHKLIIADYSSQEPRLTGLQYHEPLLIDWFKNGKDVYVEMAQKIFGREMNKKSPERAQMKSTVLGLNYGMSEYGLARKEGIDVDEARKIIDKVFHLMPTLAKGIEKQRKETLQVSTQFGRKIWLNPYSSQLSRNALNSPIQGGAADMMKAALGRLHQEWPEKFGKFGVVGYVHDEIICDVPENIAEEAKQFVKYTLEDQAGKMVNYEIPFPVDVNIGNNWSEKK